jgi:hypothetical protein
MRLWFEWVPEEDEHIERALCYLCADLLIATQGAADEFCNFEAKLPFQYCARCACGIDLVVRQEITVELDYSL